MVLKWLRKQHAVLLASFYILLLVVYLITSYISSRLHIVVVMVIVRIHIETSSVLIRQLPVEFLQRPSVWHYAPISAGIA